MKSRFIIFLLIIFIPIILWGEVNGVREDLPGGRMKLKVWGSHAERGYAQGYLLAEESVELFSTYVIGYMFSGSSLLYNQSRQLFLSNWEIDEAYLIEFASALEGITDAGESIYFEILGREIDEYDIAMVNSVVDLLSYSRMYDLEFTRHWGCSTLTSWGESTIDDPDLQGELIVTRHLDWNNAGVLDNYPLLLICNPAEEDEQKFMTFTYPLFVTGLSATNESGLTCFMNVGSNHTITNPAPYKPLLLTMRKAIEKADYNADGTCDPLDMVTAVTESARAVSAIITCVQNSETEPLIIELNNTGTAIRTVADNELAPAIEGDNLVATNHFRMLYAPQYCGRYTALAAEIAANSNFDADRQWEVLAAESGQGTWTRMTIQISPALGECRWASTQYNTPAYDTEPTVIDINEEFANWTNIGDIEISPLKTFNYPNPFNPNTRIYYEIAGGETGKLTIYNIKGEIIKKEAGLKGKGYYHWQNDNLSSGLYFYEIISGSERRKGKMVLVK